MATYLDRILEEHRNASALDARATDQLHEAALAQPPARGFRTALATAARPGVIAEVKRRSPSKGDLAAELDPATTAAEYAAGTATCLSVLTDTTWFGGSPADLQEARAAVDIPVLRKDFTVSLHDVYDARIMGADAVLLIVAALSDGELRDFHAAATDVGLDVLVEIHDEPELDRALAVGATLVGVNQRDLVTFEVDHARAERMAAQISDTVIKVAESGIRGPDDARRLVDAGYDALLVGESVVTSGDRAAAVRALRKTG
jgi:indole-3-glycerol phosphate synthase